MDKCLFDTQTEIQGQQVKLIPSKGHFRFGDGNDVMSDKLIKLPVVRGKQQVLIEASTVRK